ncbi:MAG: hypothetical protein AAGG81_03070 [Chlamydiota bacterium]
MITFVTYYFEFDQKLIQELKRLFFDFDQTFEVSPEDTAKYVEAMFGSVRKLHPDCRCLFVTDEKTELELPSYIDTLRVHRQSNFLQYERFNAYMKSFDVISTESHVIFLDMDIIVQENLDHIFDQNGDLFYTFQREGSGSIPLKENHSIVFPINNGFIAVRSGQVEKTSYFWAKILKNCLRIEDKKYHYWFGMQMVLRYYFSEHLETLQKQGCSATPPWRCKGMNIAFLDAEFYNYKPIDASSVPLDVKVVHFKGKSKLHMLSYWERLRYQS